MLASGRLSLDEVLSVVSEPQILGFYLGIKKIPITISSPLRIDHTPSFRLFFSEGRVLFKDFSTGESGNCITLLSRMWNTPYSDIIDRIFRDMDSISRGSIVYSLYNSSSSGKNSLHTTELHAITREWRDYDIEYWGSYGVSLRTLKFADVFPVLFKIVRKGDKEYSFKADKYAYCFVERKEGRMTLKFYQPYNTKGFKWCNNHDSSVISLWTKVPKEGGRLCIASSLKDALCLWENTGIPAIAPQGEKYKLSDTAVRELKRRFKKVYILFDNDSPGLEGAKSLSESTGFPYIILPTFEGGKDVSDFYYSLKDRNLFRHTLLNLFTG